MFKFLKKPDINAGIEKFNLENEAILIDVRPSEEYQKGHIPKSRNIPSHTIHNVESLLQDKSMPIFVYCQNGSQCSHVSSTLKEMGYINVESIGGISAYKGELEISK